MSDTSVYIWIELKIDIRKRQFNRKISEWSFEKNTKKAERISVLASTKRQNAFENTTFRGRKLDQAKIKRWSKQEGASLQSQAANGDVRENSGMFHSRCDNATLDKH